MQRPASSVGEFALYAMIDWMRLNVSQLNPGKHIVIGIEQKVPFQRNDDGGHSDRGCFSYFQPEIAPCLGRCRINHDLVPTSGKVIGAYLLTELLGY